MIRHDKKRPDPSRSLPKTITPEHQRAPRRSAPAHRLSFNRERESGLQKVPKKVAPRPALSKTQRLIPFRGCTIFTDNAPD